MTAVESHMERSFLPGVTMTRIQPGGKDGPNGEVHLPTRGGQLWGDTWYLGTETDDFQVRIPDIRMPANQYWPPHWHGCWTVVIPIDGEVLVGDWWMQPGDVLIAPPDLEYGPVVNGPEGCQLFEIFARDHLSPGGYAPEYHDHPTLSQSIQGFTFTDRSAENQRNHDNQTVPLAAQPRLLRSRLGGGACWDLGAADDPERGVLRDTLLGPGQRIEAHHYTDWRAIFVMAGEVEIGDQHLDTHDALIIEPNGSLPGLVAGPGGAQLLEVARTAVGEARIFS